MPYSMDPAEFPDTLFIGAQDIQLIQGIVLARDALAGVFAPMTRRGGTTQIPRKRGSQRAPGKPLQEFAFVVPLTVMPHSDSVGTEPSGFRQRRAQTWDNYTTLVTVCSGDAGDGLIALTRRRPTIAGHADHTADGEFTGASGITWADNECLEVDLNFLNTDACWFSGSTVVTP